MAGPAGGGRPQAHQTAGQARPKPTAPAHAPPGGGTGRTAEPAAGKPPTEAGGGKAQPPVGKAKVEVPKVTIEKAEALAKAAKLELSPGFVISIVMEGMTPGEFSRRVIERVKSGAGAHE